MSELGKFQNNPAWREKLREHLLKDRTPPKKLIKGQIMEQASNPRYSLDIDEDLKRCPPKANIIKQVDVSAIEPFKNKFLHKEADDTFSAMERMCDKSGSDPDSTLFEYLHSDDKEQIIHLAKNRMVILNENEACPDDTFSAMERMCDKSGSDPNSTLFQYLNSDDKQQSIQLAKNRMEFEKENKEIETLNRVMVNITTQDQLEMESPVKGVEHTLLEDIEAPSRFWDNDSSVSQDALMSFSTSKKTSPVKMVGLLRPSTIIETNEVDSTTGTSTNVSSLMSSFQTATGMKTNVSSCYETATDASFGDPSKALSVDNLFYAAIHTNKPPNLSKNEETGEDDSIVVLSSSDEGDSADDLRELATMSIKSENISSQNIGDEDKENSSSIHFNNTMEEMEYMMQKGLEYIAAGGLPASLSPKAASSDPVQFKTPALTSLRANVPTPTKAASPAHTTPQSPKKLTKQSTFVLSPQSKFKSPLVSQNKKVGTPSCLDRFAIKMEQPKRKFFKDTSPGPPASAIPLRQQMKLKPPTYNHIVSPIRAYTHKSGTAPLMSQFHKTGNEFSSEVMTQLEKESHQIDMMIMMNQQHKDGTQGNALDKSQIDGIDPSSRSLPKKAYIASKIQHVVDERTPMPMPNVPKIQKYLNLAMEPIVLRHDGKMKMPAGDSTGSVKGASVTHIPRPSTQSLADLSLASGDISLYTMKDAQKF